MVLRKLACLFTLTDEEVLNNSSRYDHYVVYSTFFRQIVSLSFTFSVVLFGLASLPNIEYWQALLITSLVSLTLFFVDQAIIGSEWSMHRDYVKSPILNGVIGFFALLVRFIPRIIYSIIIALGLATLAEIAIQSDFIDKELQIETKQLNEDFFKLRAEREAKLESEIDSSKNELKKLENSLQIKKDLNNSSDINLLETNVSRLRNTSGVSNSNRDSAKRSLDQLVLEVDALDVNVRFLKEQIASDKIQKEKEENDPSRGALCGSRCEAFRIQIIKNEIELAKKEPQLQRKKNELSAAQKNYQRTTDASQQLSSELRRALDKLNSFKSDKRSISDIETLISIEKSKLADLRDSKDLKLNQETSLLEDAGLKFNTDYGLLSRYIGLKKLHENEEIGEAAREFSLMLKVVIVLIELSAVIVAIFFSPFSFYSHKMRAKRDDILANYQHVNVLQRELEEQQEILSTEKKIYKTKLDRFDQKIKYWGAKMAKSAMKSAYKKPPPPESS